MKILVIGPSWVGDMMMSQSLYRTLQARYPQAIIDVMAPAWCRPLLSRMPEVNEAIPMPLGHGALEIGERRKLGHSLREKRYDRAYVLPNSFKSALVPFFAGLPHRSGWRKGLKNSHSVQQVTCYTASTLPLRRQLTMTDNTYQPAKVWTWDKSAGGAFANINRPVSGPTHEKTLPVGKHPLQLYSLGTPNGQKVTIMLEELLALGVTGAEYDAWLIRIGDGDQFSSGFVEVNPNSKIPALRDHTHNPPIRVFESGSILLYLA